ncbi:SpoIIE family protein phosphatase [Mycobacterium sp. ITM-2016-00316]|uniref:PP2C family protein-serine/threonine phosphatase n=1 Tax=Mycobacterium sp. ITM-2016-00316 TaxID=2099695 RepID=UPI000CF8F0BD|nr:SpoIIE family protein phosphatase [Mycobacterium sp. ITM-2016-00316]WNG82409.1 SpoIIE family protein phosphatase [Mycobacterium sp. ITM-2016-00316]
MTSLDFEDFWNNSPSGHLILTADGRIVSANSTIIDWLRYPDRALHEKSFSDLLTTGGKIHYETHFVPLLRMTGTLEGVTVDMLTADGARLPMFLTANVKAATPGSPELWRVTAVDAGDRRAYERELLEQRRRAESEQERARAFAATLRRSLHPPLLSPPPGLDAADHYHTASPDDVGGDFYDLFPLAANTWGFFLGDVAGKGVDAAVVTTLTRHVLRSAAVFDDAPVQVLCNLNAVLHQQLGIERHRLCTVVYGNLTARGDGFDVDLASAGHPPPLLLGGDGSAYFADTIGGQAVGMIEDPHFFSSRMHLGPGDTLVLYTDGLTEARVGPGTARYDDDGALLRFAREQAPAGASEFVDTIRHLLDALGDGVEDDAAVLAFGVPRGGDA